MVAPPLTPEMLDRFGEALNFAGAPLGTHFLPGLTDAAIDGLGESLGVSVPRELRTLWRWRMPPKNSSRIGYGAWLISPEFELWPPRQVISQTGAVRDIADGPLERLGFAGFSRRVLMVETDTDSPISPVIEFAFDDEEGLIAPSIGALIHLWTEQMLARDYWFDPAEGWLPEDLPMVRIIEGDGLWRPEH